MSEWRREPLARVADIRTSNVDKLSHAGEEPVLLCNYLDVYTHDYITTEIDFMTATATSSEISRFGVNRGDVLVTKDSETPDDIGISASVQDDIPRLVCGYHLALLRPDPAVIDPVFLAKQLGSAECARYFGARANGSTRYGLSYRSIAEAPVWVAPMLHQRRIASILVSLDETIEQTEALIGKLQQVKAGLMHDLFIRGVLPNGELRPPRDEAPYLYSQSALGWIPNQWHVRPIAEQIRVIDCRHYTPEYLSQGYPVVRPRNIRWDGLDFTDVSYVSRHDFLRLTEAHRPRRGDIVYSRNASFGVACYVDSDVEFAIGQDVVVMTESASLPGFVYGALCSDGCARQVRRLSGGSTFGRINLGDISRILLPSPGKPEQEAIAERVFLMTNSLRVLSEQVAEQRSLKLGLMHDLLRKCQQITGRISLVGV